MIRCLIISSFIHLLLVSGVVIGTLIQPSVKHPRIMAHFVAGPPGPPGGGAPKAAEVPAPAPPPAPVKPAPETPPAPKKPEPTAKPKPTAPPVKQPERAQKKVIAKNTEIVESVPPKFTPTPTQTPQPAPPPEEPASKQEKAIAKAEPTPKKADKPSVELGALNDLKQSAAPQKNLAEIKTAGGAKMSMNVAPSSGPGGPADGATPGGEWGSGTLETYGRMALYKIQQNFKPPYNLPGVRSVVQFKIMRDGTIVDPKIVQSSGREDLNQSALRALKDTEKLQELYDEYTKPYVEVAVTFEFERAQ